MVVSEMARRDPRRTVLVPLMADLFRACGCRGQAQLDKAIGACYNHPVAGKNRIQPTPFVVVRFLSPEGTPAPPETVPKIIRTDHGWRQLLTPEQFGIIRSSGTERPFCSGFLKNKKSGIYKCAGCGLPLFSSSAKFESGTGWPSFFAPLAPENVVERLDTSHGMIRTEVLCALCDAHLGHVFNDGPPPTGLRYCLNSTALVFVADSGR